MLQPIPMKCSSTIFPAESSTSTQEPFETKVRLGVVGWVALFHACNPYALGK